MSSGRSRSGGTSTTVSTSAARGAAMAPKCSAVTAQGADSGPWAAGEVSTTEGRTPATMRRRGSAAPAGRTSTSHTMTAVCVSTSGPHSESQASTSWGAGARAQDALAWANLAQRLRQQGRPARAGLADRGVACRERPAAAATASFHAATVTLCRACRSGDDVHCMNSAFSRASTPTGGYVEYLEDHRPAQWWLLDPVPRAGSCGLRPWPMPGSMAYHAVAKAARGPLANPRLGLW